MKALLRWPLPLMTEPASAALYDRGILWSALALMAIGLVVVTSASLAVADRLYGNPFYFAIRHGIYLLLACAVALTVMRLPLDWWQRHSGWLLLVAIVLLVTVLIAGRSVNGARRWLALGPITIQVAEVAKLFYFSYLASYLVRRHEEVVEHPKGFIKPLAVLGLLSVLLLMQPDMGTMVVLAATTMGLLFLAGARLWQFIVLLAMLGIILVGLIAAAPYRMRRVTSFLDPWQDPFGAGYQLTQSLMAYGRGGWLGQGLGNSIQKLEYLPEAHTDFVFAILAEELGFAGVAVVLVIVLVLITKALLLGRQALEKQHYYGGFFAYAIGIWMSFQTAVNVGASAGILPTKGLTFPLLSYGGSSLLIMAAAVAVLLRVDFELRLQRMQACRREVADD